MSPITKASQNPTFIRTQLMAFGVGAAAMAAVLVLLTA
jgi:hypothetical protein